jgi:hypothetical protein
MWARSGPHRRASARIATGGKLYDSFGAQRPGRAFYLKLTADL